MIKKRSLEKKLKYFARNSQNFLSIDCIGHRAGKNVELQDSEAKQTGWKPCYNTF